MKNKVFKSAVIGIGLLLLGCGFEFCSRLFPPREFMPTYIQAQNQKIVYRVADSCLRYAKSCEAHGKKYSPKEYFNAIRSIDSVCKKYNVQSPGVIIKDLKLILTDGTGYVPIGMRDAFNKSYRSVHNYKPITLDDMKDLLKGIFVLFTIIGFVFLMRITPEIVREIIKIVGGISFKLIKEDTIIVINRIITKIWRECLSRPPNGYHSKMEKVRWLFI